MAGTFSSIAELLGKSATQEYELILGEKLRALEAEYKVKLEKLFEEARKEAKIKAQHLSIDLLHRADIAGIEVRVRA